MIIFGFYGTGKTTVCKETPGYLDLDFYDLLFSEDFGDINKAQDAYRAEVIAKSKEYDVVFINRYDPNIPIDVAYIQGSYNDCIRDIRSRKQGNFIPDKEEYDAVKSILSKRVKTIFLKHGEHISEIGNFNFRDRTYAEQSDHIRGKGPVMRTAQQIKDDKEKLARLQERTRKLEEKITRDEARLKKATRDECITICLDAIIVGCDGLKARHGMTAPYTHEYYITSHSSLITHEYYYEPVTASSFEQLPEKLYDYLCNKKGWGYQDFLDLKERSDEEWAKLPTSYTPGFYPVNDGSKVHGHHIANGYETDGFDNIVKDRLGGTYSSMTTTSQNELSRLLIVLKGFCPDCYLKESKYKDMVSDVYSRHSIDANLDDLGEWARRNPTRCDSDNPVFISKKEMEEEIEEELE